MRTLLVLSLAFSSLFPALASAQGSDTGEVTTYDFLDGDTVEGTFQRPEGDRVWGTHGHAHRTLIVPRAHYVPEMMRSVENL
jgi:hypothetical protein